MRKAPLRDPRRLRHDAALILGFGVLTVLFLVIMSVVFDRQTEHHCEVMHNEVACATF